MARSTPVKKGVPGVIVKSRLTKSVHGPSPTRPRHRLPTNRVVPKFRGITTKLGAIPTEKSGATVIDQVFEMMMLAPWHQRNSPGQHRFHHDRSEERRG